MVGKGGLCRTLASFLPDTQYQHAYGQPRALTQAEVDGTAAGYRSSRVGNTAPAGLAYAGGGHEDDRDDPSPTGVRALTEFLLRPSPMVGMLEEARRKEKTAELKAVVEAVVGGAMVRAVSRVG